MPLITTRPPLTRRSRVVVAPKPIWRQAIDAPATIVAALHWYRRTPARLRRPEPALRLTVTGVTMWFAVLFVALGALAGRLTPTGDLAAARWWSAGFYGAAVLGVAGMATFLTRRHRIGLGLIAGMLVLAQTVAVLAII